MTESNSKIQLNVLLRPYTRLELSIIYDRDFKDKYNSFSRWIEDVILLGLKNMEVE